MWKPHLAVHSPGPVKGVLEHRAAAITVRTQATNEFQLATFYGDANSTAETSAMVIHAAVQLKASGVQYSIMGDFKTEASELSALARHLLSPATVIVFGPICFFGKQRPSVSR